MVINFNLLLVWLPMCKYSLTRLSYLANNSMRHLKQILHQHYQEKLLPSTSSSSASDLTAAAQKLHQLGGLQLQVPPHRKQKEGDAVIVIDHIIRTASDKDKRKSSKRFHLLLSKVVNSANGAIWQLQCWFYNAKLNSISSFLMAVDHCTSLHTICATTITIASGKLLIIDYKLEFRLI